MNLMVDVIVSLEISTLIIASVVCLLIVILIIVSKTRATNYEIDSVDIGLSGPSFHICSKKGVRQVAYKIWVEINTRVIGLKIDLDQDVIRAIHESYYAFFKGVRALTEEIQIGNAIESKNLIDLTIRFLNEVMRPYLTKWGLKFNDWYDKNSIGSRLTPQELQKLFPNYDELTANLVELNSKVISYSSILNSIAFGAKKKKRND